MATNYKAFDTSAHARFIVRVASQDAHLIDISRPFSFQMSMDKEGRPLVSPHKETGEMFINFNVNVLATDGSKSINVFGGMPFALWCNNDGNLLPVSKLPLPVVYDEALRRLVVHDVKLFPATTKFGNSSKVSAKQLAEIFGEV